MGLPLGLRALAVERGALPRGAPLETGGGVVELVLPRSAVWADAPHRFEAGTPPVMNAIALAVALQLRRRFGDDCFESAGCFDVGRATRAFRGRDPGGRRPGAYSGAELLARLRAQRIGHDLRVPTAEGMRPFVNLDNAASTPTFRPVWDVVTATWRQPQAVRADLVRETRRILAAFLGAGLDEYEVVFTSNTTEALNVAARLLAVEQEGRPGGIVLNTLLEHNSNELPWRSLAGGPPLRLPVDGEGFVSLAELERVLRQRNRDGAARRDRIGLVALSGGSNVLGTFHDVPAIARLVHCHGARLLVDAAQLIAHRAVRMSEWGVDYLALSGHKAYAPFGTGALVVRKEHVHVTEDELARIEGSGEENVAGVAALGKAVLLLQRIGLPVIEAAERALQGRLLRGLSEMGTIEVLGDGGVAAGERRDRGGVVSFCATGMPHNLVAKRLAEDGGIGVRNGCFCAHLLVARLLRIGRARMLAAGVGLLLFPRLTRPLLPGLVRVSLGLENSEADVDRLVRVLRKVTAAPGSVFDRLLARTRNGTWKLPRTSVQREIESLVAARVDAVYGRDERRKKGDAHAQNRIDETRGPRPSCCR